jgi:purine-binding chemotaxis protein CheW
LQLIAFRIGGEEFGIDVMKVERVLKTPEIRSVPQSPEFVEGVVSVQEDVVPVIDMRKRFSVPQSEWAVPGALLVARIAADRVALVVDEVPGVARPSVESLSPAPEFFKGLAGRYLDGIAQEADRLIVLLNLDEILGSQERIALGEMIEAAKGKPKKDDSTAAKPSGKKKKRGGARKKKKSSG